MATAEPEIAQLSRILAEVENERDALRAKLRGALRELQGAEQARGRCPSVSGRLGERSFCERPAGHAGPHREGPVCWNDPPVPQPEGGPEATALYAWRDRLAWDPDVSDGSPVVKGTWVTASHVVSLIVDGWAWGDVLRCHPEITEYDIRACLAYTVAAESAGGADLAPAEVVEPRPVLDYRASLLAVLDWLIYESPRPVPDECHPDRKVRVPKLSGDRWFPTRADAVRWLAAESGLGDGVLVGLLTERNR